MIEAHIRAQLDDAAYTAARAAGATLPWQTVRDTILPQLQAACVG
jgi:ABC-type amino acid transport system permease subunit